MGRPKKHPIKTTKTIDEFDNIVEVEGEVLEGLIRPQQWDIDEEFNLSNSEALRQIRQEQEQEQEDQF